MTVMPKLPSDAELIKFLKSQPSNDGYDYMEPGGCALGLFLFESGFEFHHIDKSHIYRTPIIDSDDPQLAVPLPEGWDMIVKAKPWTFGAAAERAEKILS